MPSPEPSVENGHSDHLPSSVNDTTKVASNTEGTKMEDYVLVLGPGMARGLAYVGVIRELVDRQVPIRAVVGVEMGALIGAIWASTTVNGLEWEIHKLQRKTFYDPPLFSLRGDVAEGKRLLSYLGQAIKVDRLNQLRMPVVVYSSVVGGDVLSETDGSSKDIVRGALGIPGYLSAYQWEGQERYSAGGEAPFPVNRARALGLGKVICVDVLGHGANYNPSDATSKKLVGFMKSAAAIAQNQLKECDVVIDVPMDRVDFLDFDQKAEWIQRGKNAVRGWLEHAQ